MKYAVVAAAMAATAAAATAGDGVPLIYAATPYPNPPYKGTQYNATVINGVTFNASNEWPCLTAEQYYTLPPACAKQCLKDTFKNATVCADDDFTCHCTAEGSADLDKYVIPCLAAADGLCSGVEIGQVANFVHAALCPYFAAVSREEAYGHCGGSNGGGYGSPSSSKGGNYGSSSTSQWGGYGSPSSSKGGNYGPAPTTSSKGGDSWPKPSSSSSSSAWAKPSVPCVTSTQTSWTKECAGPTTFWVGSKTWTITKATTLTVTDWPIVWTKPVESGVWAPVEWTTPAAPVVVASPTPTWVYSSSPAAAAGWAKGTAAYSASPVEFTGAASNNKVAGAVAAVAAGAALLI